MKSLAKRLAHALLGQYAIYHVFSRSNASVGTPALPLPEGCRLGRLERLQVEASDDVPIRDRAFYFVDEANGWGCFDVRGRILALCVYWHGERYRQRNFWPLGNDEAKLIEIITVPEMRGQGLAAALIAHSCAAMFEQGFRCAYARIWHSNAPSLSAFRKAGWTQVATVFDVYPLALPWRLRFVRRLKPAVDNR